MKSTPNYLNPKPKNHFDEGSKVMVRNEAGLISEGVRCVVCYVLCWVGFKSLYAPSAYVTSKKLTLKCTCCHVNSPIRIPSQLMVKLNTFV